MQITPSLLALGGFAARYEDLNTMTFKYSVTLPITGSHKLSRFKTWADENVPQMLYSLPPQTPIKTETMTIRLSSLEDRKALMEAFARTSNL